MELNREQIIKALECCTSETTGCMGCPRFPSLMGCSRQNMRDALSLINELTEKVEAYRNELGEVRFALAEANNDRQKLTEENKAWQQGLISQEEQADKAYYELACEVEDLRAIAEQYQKQFEEAKADTVRKMQSEIKDRCIKFGIYPAFVARTIDQIAEEMLEGEK